MDGNDISQAIARRMRARRKMPGLSAAELGSRVGLSFFQLIHKYETGQVTVSAARLYNLALALEVGVQELFPNRPVEPRTFEPAPQ